MPANLNEDVGMFNLTPDIARQAASADGTPEDVADLLERVANEILPHCTEETGLEAVLYHEGDWPPESCHRMAIDIQTEGYD